MKKLLLLAVLLTPLNAAEPNTPARVKVGRLDWFTAYAPALAQARQEGKPLFIAFTAPWCTWCAKMREFTFPEDRVQKELAEFVRVFVDIQQDQQTARAYRILSTPRVIVLGEQQKIIGDWQGFYDPDALLEMLKGLLENQPAEAAPAPEISKPPVPKINLPAQLNPADPNTLQSLYAWLGHQDPEVRRQVKESLMKLGKQAQPLLKLALGNFYLGTRITAWELFQQLDPAAVAAYDPWAPAETRQNNSTISQADEFILWMQEKDNWNKYTTSHSEGMAQVEKWILDNNNFLKIAELAIKPSNILIKYQNLKETNEYVLLEKIPEIISPDQIRYRENLPPAQISRLIEIFVKYGHHVVTADGPY